MDVAQILADFTSSVSTTVGGAIPAVLLFAGGLMALYIGIRVFKKTVK